MSSPFVYECQLYEIPDDERMRGGKKTRRASIDFGLDEEGPSRNCKPFPPVVPPPKTQRMD